MMPMLRLLILGALSLLMLACGQQKQSAPPTTLILIRHAEKVQDGSDNPSLTAKGYARAQLLKNMLVDTGLDAIYSTPFQRNVLTVKPLADTLGLALQEYDPQLGLNELMAQVLEAQQGKKVLICGHSNTVPRMLNVLLETDSYADLPDEAYDNFFLISIPGRGKGTLTQIKFKPCGS